MITEMQKRALAARDAHLALLELKKLVDDAARTTHAAEFEAIHLAINPSQSGDIRMTLQVVVDHLKSAHFESTLSLVREKLETALGT
jgi:hypothetical protein